jgi:hypothetical protein
MNSGAGGSRTGTRPAISRKLLGVEQRHGAERHASVQRWQMAAADYMAGSALVRRQRRESSASGAPSRNTGASPGLPRKNGAIYVRCCEKHVRC